MCSGVAVEGLSVKTVGRGENCQMLPLNIQWTFHEHDCNIVSKTGIKVNATHYWTYLFTHRTARVARAGT
jgi:hypothetical protein